MTEAIRRRRLFWLGVLALFAAATSASLRIAIARSLKEQRLDPTGPVRAGELIGAILLVVFGGTWLFDQRRSGARPALADAA